MNQEDLAAIQMADQFSINLNLNDEEEEEEAFREENDSDDEEEEEAFREENDSDEEDSDEEEFSFSLAFNGGINESQITAEEAFSNGCIKPVYPLFNQDLLLEEKLNTAEFKLPNLKKVFVPAMTTTAATPSGNDEDISGPYCDWDSKLVGTTTCKKSNSTGFSKIWRFKDFKHRSNSDGKDAFVFLNNSSSSATAAEASAGRTVSRIRKEKKKRKELPGSKVNGDERKAMVVVGDSKTKAKGKKIVVKSNTAPSPHEVYLKSKAKAEQRRRSYLTYRPEVVGLFTNIAGGGLTRNVHPF